MPRVGPLPTRADALRYLDEMRVQGAYGVSDGTPSAFLAGASCELTAHEETHELARQCRDLLYPGQAARA